MLTDCKPGYVSRTLPRNVTIPRVIRPVASFIYTTCRHAAPAAYPPTMDGPSLNAGILGLATHGTCGTACHHAARWALTPPFHPCRNASGGCFLSRYPAVTDSFPLRNVVPCVARTFLPPLIMSAGGATHL